ncbi:MAG: DUF2442 domain-containing protein [Kiritimatiellae bacterium]|nr:DUF2442 domain-containing protein [Kiritimatiellia bacterium]
MNASIETKAGVSFGDGRFLVRLPNDVIFSFPISGNRRFERATREQLVHVEMDDEGLHWPDIDEDLSFAGLLRGDWGQHIRTPEAMHNAECRRHNGEEHP